MKMMFNNQKQVDDINKQVKAISPELSLSSFCVEDKTVVSAGIKLPIKGNSELIRKLENIGFKKLWKEKSPEPQNLGYASGRYKGYSMYQKMSIDLRK